MHAPDSTNTGLHSQHTRLLEPNRHPVAAYLIAWVLGNKAVIIYGEYVPLPADHEPKTPAC